MRYVGIILITIAFVQSSSQGDEPTIRPSLVTSGDLPAEFDSTRTYHYTLQCTNPDSLIEELWKAGIRVWQAWLPLDNKCMGPLGPQFTVELVETDPAVDDFEFLPGEGRLHCATRLKRFVISE